MERTSCNIDDLPGDVICKIASALSIRERARLMSCNKQLRHLSCTQGGLLWGELELALTTLEGVRSFLPFLERRGHLVQSLAASLYYVAGQDNGLMHAEWALGLARTLSDGALRELTLYLDMGVLLLGSWLTALPALCKLSVRGAGVRIASDFSQLSALTSLEAWDCDAALPAGCVPAGLRALTLGLADGGRRLPPAVAAARGLEELLLETAIDDAEGLQQLGSLTSLSMVTAEVGVPRQVAALKGLRALQILPGVLYGEHLELLTGLTNLTPLALENGGDGGMMLSPLPAALLALPQLEDLTVEFAIPAPGITGSPPEAPSLRSLTLCIATLASSPDTLAALTSLTSLCLIGLYDEDNCPPLAVPAVTTLMANLAALPHLGSLEWTVSFPLAGAGGPVAPGSAGAAEGAPQQGQHAQQGQQAAPPPSNTDAPTWQLQLHRGAFPSLRQLKLKFADPDNLWGSTVGAKHVVPWLGIAAWMGCMHRLEQVKLVDACETDPVLRGALPPGVKVARRYW